MRKVLLIVIIGILTLLASCTPCSAQDAETVDAIIYNKQVSNCYSEDGSPVEHDIALMAEFKNSGLVYMTDLQKRDGKIFVINLKNKTHDGKDGYAYFTEFVSLHALYSDSTVLHTKIPTPKGDCDVVLFQTKDKKNGGSDQLFHGTLPKGERRERAKGSM